MKTAPPAPARARFLAASLACVALSASASPATTLRRMDLADLVARADRVVHARVVDQRVYWDPTGTQIYTDTVFEVLEEAKSHGPRQLTVLMHGGRIDPVEISSPGTPTFAVGQEAVLFTTPRPDGKKNLVGFSQGHMPIVIDADGNKTAVSTVPAGVTFLEGKPGQAPQVVRGHRFRVALDELMDQVRRLAVTGRPATGAPKRPAPVDLAPEKEENR